MKRCPNCKCANKDEYVWCAWCGANMLTGERPKSLDRFDKEARIGRAVMWDEASISPNLSSKGKFVQKALCFLKFGRCDPKAMELYERLKKEAKSK